MRLPKAVISVIIRVMSRYKKYDKRNKDYYLSELDEQTLKKRAVILRVLTIAAAAFYVPFIALYFVGYRAAAYISESYDALSAYIALTFALPVALVWCAVMSFFSYTPVREMPARKSPPFGFRAIPFVGMLVTLLLSLALAAYHTVLAALSGGSPSDTGGAVSLWICFALVAAYYVFAFVTYRASVLVEEETEEEESERIILPTFRLSEEEIERGKAEFEPPKPKKKKKPHGGDDAGADNGGASGADESGSDGAENGNEDGSKK